MNRLDHKLNLRLPHDPELPGLGKLLDSNHLAQAAAGLFPGRQVMGCRPLYVRYKPGTNAVAAWAVELDGQEAPVLIHGKAHNRQHFATAQEKAETTRWLETTAGLPYFALPQDALLLFGFPNDPSLAGLRLATDRKKMQRALYAHVTSHPEAQWRLSDRRMVIETIRFKPEKRAVLSIVTKAVHRETGHKEIFRVFARVSSNPRAEQVAALMTRLSSELQDHPFLSTPPALVHLAEANLTLVPDAEAAEMAANGPGVRAAGQALAVLHGLSAAGLAQRGYREVLAAALDNTSTLANLLPEKEKEIQELAAEIAGRADAHERELNTLVHGDFHPEQLLARNAGVVLLDFDRSYAGDPMADLGNYRAHLSFRQIVQAGPDAVMLGEEFVKKYGEAGGMVPHPGALAFWTALGLLNLAPAPFRSLDPEWPRLTAGLLAACRKELACA